MSDNQQPEFLDDNEEHKDKASQRLKQMRDITFKILNDDYNDEFESVPAYIRRNMELFGDENKRTQYAKALSESHKDEYHIRGFSSNNFLRLYFSLSEYSETEIVEIISLLSDLYNSIGGDELEIKSVKTFQFINQPTPELA